MTEPLKTGSAENHPCGLRVLAHADRQALTAEVLEAGDPIKGLVSFGP
jgi:hypothetical protein